MSISEDPAFQALNTALAGLSENSKRYLREKWRSVLLPAIKEKGVQYYECELCGWLNSSWHLQKALGDHGRNYEVCDSCCFYCKNCEIMFTEEGRYLHKYCINY
jgi:hypothetical protein